jgi:hypothetical protein
MIMIRDFGFWMDLNWCGLKIIESKCLIQPLPPGIWYIDIYPYKKKILKQNKEFTKLLYLIKNKQKRKRKKR